MGDAIRIAFQFFHGFLEPGGAISNDSLQLSSVPRQLLLGLLQLILCALQFVNFRVGPKPLQNRAIDILYRLHPG